MKKRRKGKKHALQVHTQQRALERYGLELRRDDIAAIVSDIQRGSARFLERQSERVTKWEVAHQGQLLIVVYDKKHHTLITALPKDAEETACNPIL